MRKLAIQLWTALSTGCSHYPRLLMVIGAVCSIVVGYIAVADNLEFPAKLFQAEMARKEDIYHLYSAASAASWKDIPQWFIGPWNYPGVNYYRPVTSVLFLLENRAFHDN